MRLAELVAALSLGIDLGFGQPMEHVLRQCLIALRLAERVDLGEEERSVVYYTALLINVGCHSDAHEQAKWFGDDIAMKSGKYDHELGSISGALAMLRLIGSGNPPLHRFRVGVEFAVSGRYDLDGMIDQHAALADASPKNSDSPSGCRRRSVPRTSSGTAGGGLAISRAMRFQWPPDWPRSQNSSRWRIASGVPEQPSRWPTSGPGRSSTQPSQQRCAATPR